MVQFPRIWTPNGEQMIRIGAQEHMFGTTYIGKSFAINTARQGKLIMIASQQTIYPIGNSNAPAPADIHAVGVGPFPYFMYYDNTIHQPEGPTNGKYTDDGYSRSAGDHSKYLFKVSAGYWLLDPSKETLITDMISDLASSVGAWDMDGIFLDNLGWTAVTNSTTYTEYNADGTPTGGGTFLPWNFGTGAAHTKKTWTEVTRYFTARLKEACYRAGLESYVCWINGLGNGDRYWDGTAPTSVLLDVCDGGMSEIFVRDANDSADISTVKTETKWKLDVNMLIDVALRKKAINAVCKLWVTGLTQAQIDQWERYALACYLMGADARSCFMYSHAAVGSSTTTPTEKRSTSDHNEGVQVFSKFDNDLGSPIDNYTDAAQGKQVAGHYKRAFKNGLVLANPTGSTVSGIALGGTYHPGANEWSPNGNTSPITTITLAAHEAAILISG